MKNVRHANVITWLAITSSNLLSVLIFFFQDGVGWIEVPIETKINILLFLAAQFVLILTIAILRPKRLWWATLTFLMLPFLIYTLLSPTCDPIMPCIIVY